MPISAITLTGGTILGEALWEQSKVPMFLSQERGTGTLLLEGAKTLRKAKRTEWETMPVLSLWTWNYVVEVAEDRLASNVA
jgi:hypothetical protein